MKKLVALIVDDSPIQLSVIEQQLKKFGVENITTCHCGQDALNIISERHYDIVFCDIMMPEMDGISLIRKLDNIGYKGALAITSSVNHCILSSLTYMSKKLGFSNVYKLAKPISEALLEQVFQKEAIIKKKSMDWKLKSVDMDELIVAINGDEFKNYYQPQFDFCGNLVGVEALARWIHPLKRIIFPDIFMPMIHTGKLEYELFKVVLNNALNDISQGRLNCRVSINVTQQDLEIPDFIDSLLELCQRYQVDPEMINLELTEQDVYKDAIEIITNVTRMRLHGIGFSIDDFGTGSSSYLKLSHLPFTEIKIDKNFVFDSVANETKQSIIRSMCTLSKNLGITLVSEGVEDEETWQLMKELGVDVCQGYYTGRPMPIEALSVLNIVQ